MRVSTRRTHFRKTFQVLAIAFKSRDDIFPYSVTNGQSHLLDQYADNLTIMRQARSDVVSEFKLLGLWFDQTLQNMDIN